MRVLPRFWCSSRRKNLLSQAFLASLWWVQVKIVLTVKTLYVQEGYKCLILAEGAQKVGEFSCYFSNPPAQRLTTLVSHSEANPKNNWMRGEQACLAPTAVQARIQLVGPPSGTAASTAEDFPPPAFCCDHYDHRDHYYINMIIETGMVIIESIMLIMRAVQISSSSKPWCWCWWRGRGCWWWIANLSNKIIVFSEKSLTGFQESHFFVSILGLFAFSFIESFPSRKLIQLLCSNWR